MTLQKILKYLFLVILSMSIFTIGYIYSGLKYLPPHHHANFAVYIEGKLMDFSADTYMEDIAGCSLSGKQFPRDRVHMHENNGATVHVHAAGVSWEHFFSNIGYRFGKKYVITDNDESILKETGKSVSYILNGKKIDFPMKELIGSKDRLLINYGDESEEILAQRYSLISQDAAEYNEKYDPGSCGGTNQNGIIMIAKDLLDSFFPHPHDAMN